MKQLIILITLFIIGIVVSCHNHSNEWLLDGEFIEKTPPKLMSVTPKDEETLILTFDEYLSIKTAENKDNYNINPELEIQSANLEYDQKTVTLKIDKQKPATKYTITVQNITDIVGNVIKAPNNTKTFTGFGNTTTIIETHAYKFDISADSDITEEKSFNVKIITLDYTTHQIKLDYNSTVDWSVNSDGELIDITSKGWENGIQLFQMTYKPKSPLEKNEAITITATDNTDNSITGTSGVITVNPQVFMSHFNIVTPESITADSNFNVTIKAMGSDYKVFTEYSGTVDLTMVDGIGDFNQIDTINFTNGVSTIKCKYSKVGDEFRLKVTDKANSKYKGVSEPISVGFGIGENYTLNFLAIPVDSTKICLSWNTFPSANSYKIYRKTEGNDYSLLDTLSAVTFYNDTEVVQGTTYMYKIEALDGSSSVISVSEAQTIPNSCNNISSNITSNQTWTKAESPYCVTADIIVTATLIIEAGCVIRFSSGVGITIGTGGELKATGNASEMILFTSASSNPTEGDWKGIIFNSDATPSAFDVNDEYISGSLIKYCAFEYAGPAITSSIALDIEYCLIRYNLNSSHGGGLSFNLSSGKIVMRYSTITQNSISSADSHGGGGYFTGSGSFLFEKNMVTYNSNGSGTSNGGGLYINIPNSEVNECYFAGNTTSNSGGGIAFNVDGTVSNNTFLNNTSTVDGAGIYFEVSGTADNNIFQSNNASDDGGGLNFATGGLATNNTFTNNTAGDDGGGILFLHAGTATNNTFTSNSASGGGGCIKFTYIGGVASNNTLTNNTAANGGGIAIFELATITNNTFNGNIASSLGGGIYEDGSTSSVNSNTFNGNSAVKGGGVFFDYGSVVTSSDNVFVSNTAQYGGGIYFYEPSTATDNIFSKNIASNKGGGIYCLDSNNTISNNLFINNESYSDGGGIAFCNSCSNSNITGNTFTSNSASKGGAIESNSELNNISNNVITANEANEGGGVYTYDGSNTYTLSHNNIYNNIATGTRSDKNLHNSEDGSVNGTDNYWGGETSNKCLMGIADSTTTSGSCIIGAGNVDITGAKATAWVLCIDNPSEPTCVGSTLSY